jgi:hypothetical protein
MTLDVLAVEAFTEGRLNRDDAETQRQLDAALAAARGYCGWHVTPVRTGDQVIADGRGGALLALPTLALSAVTAVTEDGVELDVDTLEWSLRGLVRKPYGQLWTTRFSGVTATITHGYASVPDFESAVLSAIERGAFAAGGGETLRAVGPFQYNAVSIAAGSVFTDPERAVLDRYALERTP